MPVPVIEAPAPANTPAPAPVATPPAAPAIVVDPRGATVTMPSFTESSSASTIAAAPGSLVGNDASRTGSGRAPSAIDIAPEQQIRRNAELSDVYTRSEGFRTVVAKADEPALVIFRGVPDQYTESGTRISLTVPSDAFAHTQPKEVVRLAATLQDGRPLPNWVQFNAQTGQFNGEVPDGLRGELRIKVIARDMQGREAAALFRINIGNLNQKTSDGGKNLGRTGLSDQLRQPSMSLRQAERLGDAVRGMTGKAGRTG